MKTEHWMTTGLLGASGTFQRAAREYAEEYAAMAVADERERCAKLVETQDTYGDIVQGWFDLLAKRIRGPNVVLRGARDGADGTETVYDFDE